MYWSLALCLLIKLIFYKSGGVKSDEELNNKKHHNFNPTQRVFGTPLSQHKATPIPCFLGVHLIPNPPLKSKNICTSFSPSTNQKQRAKKILPWTQSQFPHFIINPMYCDVQSCHPFKTHYVRNNRRSTEKNLRCFPCCNKDGHVSQGFCGRGMKQKVILTKACLGKYSKRRSSSCNYRSNSFH